MEKELILQLIPVTILEWVFVSIVFLSLLIQTGIYLNVFTKVSKHSIPEAKDTYPPISVIICARNEEENLLQHLPIILGQDYPQFEVVVVNDSSEDNSDLILSVLKKKHTNLYYTTIPSDKKFVHSKKLAINIGIKAAKYEHLLFTDADCYPTSNNWIKEMAKGFLSSKKDLVIGYSPFEKKKGFLNRFIRYEAFWNGVQYLGYAIKGKAYMGVGRNMAYTKNLFKQNKGFNKHNYISSGDDDLFIGQVANTENTEVVTSTNGQMITKPCTSFSEWHRQKSRHLTTAPHYKFTSKFKIISEVCTRQILWLAAFYSIFFSNFAVITGGALLLKLSLQLIVLKGAANKLDEKNIYWSSLIFDFLLPIIIFIFHAENQFRSKQVKWK